MSNKYREVEFKYSAENISLETFETFCQGRDKLKSKAIAFGPDYFYQNASNPDAFCRHRVGPEFNQLTFKKKTTDANNYVRTEHNVDLQPHMTVEQIAAMVSEFGYKFNTTILKSCFIYQYDFYTLVYYICYDKKMEQLGRFIEIEMAEDHGWRTPDEAWDALVAMERICKPLGISPQARIKRSLFELFRKEVK